MVHDLLAVQIPLLEKVVRSTAVYLFLLMALRLGGKRELAQLNKLRHGGLAAAVQYGPERRHRQRQLAARWRDRGNRAAGHQLRRGPAGVPPSAVARALEGTPTVLVDNGRMLDHNLRRYLISKEELAAAIRRQGARSLTDVETAVLEANGTLTVGPDHYIGHEPGADHLAPEEFRAHHGRDGRLDDPGDGVTCAAPTGFRGSMSAATHGNASPMATSEALLGLGNDLH